MSISIDQNISHIPFRRFLVGREKDPAKSEVARLIQQSIAQDRVRETMRDKEQDRLKQLEDSFHPKDEVMEHHLHEHQTHSYDLLTHKVNGHTPFPKEQEEGQLDVEEEEEEEQLDTEDGVDFETRDTEKHSNENEEEKVRFCFDRLCK